MGSVSQVVIHQSGKTTEKEDDFPQTMWKNGGAFNIIANGTLAVTFTATNRSYSSVHTRKING